MKCLRSGGAFLVLLLVFSFWPGRSLAMFDPSSGKVKSKGQPSVHHLYSFKSFQNAPVQGIGVPRRKINFWEVNFRKPPLKEFQKKALSTFAAEIPAFKVYFSDRNGLPVFIKGKPLYVPSSREGIVAQNREAKEIALKALDRFKALMRLKDPEQEFFLRSESQDETGRKHLRFSQYYRGIPYFGKEVTVHLDPNGAVYLIEGRYAETPSLDTSPQISASEACRRAQNTEKAQCYHTELVIYEDRAGIPRLSWKVDFCKGLSCWRAFVDAHTGLIFHQYRLLEDWAVPGSGRDEQSGELHNFSVWQEGDEYFFIDTSLSIHQQDPNISRQDFGRGNIVLLVLPYGDPQYGINWLTSSSPDSWPAAAVSIWYALKKTLEYYQRVHHRPGMDAHYESAVGVIGLAQANAFYSPEFNDFMFFGTGDGRLMSSLTALDVIAHEFTHGVTHYTARLEYQFQSGALNEAFSDIFACMIDRDDWTIGEDVVLVPPYNLRDLRDPHHSLSPRPANMDEYQDLPISQDNGGVHINATIPAHAAYLLANAIGREKAEKILYKVLTEHLTPESDFSDFCRAMIQSAQELYGSGTETQAAENACQQIGISVNVSEGEGGGGGEEETPLPPLAGKDYLLFLFYQLQDGELVPYIGVLYPDGSIYYLSETPAHDTRPAPYYDPETQQEYAFFVDKDFNLRSANILSPTYEERIINNSGEIWSVATTPSAEKVVYTSIYEDDPNIYLWHPQTGQTERIPLSFVPPDASSSLKTLFPDVVSFAPDGQRVFFDCFNQVSFGEKTYRFWSIGELDLLSRKTLPLVPIPPEGYHIGNPAAAAIHPDLLAYDLWDEQTVETRLLDLRSGQSGLAWVGLREQGLGTSGWPTFSGDDSSLYVQDLDPTYAEILIRVPIQEKGGKWWGDLNRATEVLRDEENGYGIVRPVAFRVGKREVAPKASVSPSQLNFGQVIVDTPKVLYLTLRNEGNYPLEFRGTAFENQNEVFKVRAIHQHIDPGKEYRIAVIFQPKAATIYHNQLEIYTSDPSSQVIKVSLRGEGITGGSEGSTGGVNEPPQGTPKVGPADPVNNPYMVLRNGTVDINFNFTQPVYIFAGMISCDFKQIKWLNCHGNSCSFANSFSFQKVSTWQGQRVPLPFENGYIFWIVVNSDDLTTYDWQSNYLLQYYLVGSCK